MRSAISPFFGVRRIQGIVSALLCFGILFAADAQTVFACASTSLSIYNDNTYVYADAVITVSGCVPCYAAADVTLTSPTNRSVEQYVYNGFVGYQAEASVSLPINADTGTWTANAGYDDTDGNYYTRVQTLNLGFSATNYKQSFQSSSSCVYSVDCDSTPTCGAAQGFSNVTTGTPCYAYYLQQFVHSHLPNGSTICHATSYIPPNYFSGGQNVRVSCN